ncbi:hypothetical protein CC86DRAFT_403966 [Ophiobolus disseminans]|uniref:Uncharacterized protein n=1 Tax=Ophiobolus disseminans TaxID=1469910 RepID=A0A6A7A811_9PLEO|nr:hypothetical protein CC86DRAFT_403966 [Ophiobolus disseminans]
MQYSIKAIWNEPPYITSTQFIVHNYRQWDFEVTEHQDNSLLIKELKYRERRAKLNQNRLSLLQVWAREVIRRRNDTPPAPPVASLDRSLDRTATLLQDFVKAIAVQGELHPPRPIHWYDPTLLKRNHVPLPNHPGLDLVLRYLGFLHYMRVTPNAPRSDFPGGVARPHINTADRIVLEFRAHGEPSWNQTAAALHAVAERSGQFNRGEYFVHGPENKLLTGGVRVELWVDVSDCVDGDGGGESMEPPPRYEADEGLPGYGEGSNGRVEE